MTQNARIQLRKDTAANWSDNNPTLTDWEAWMITDSWTLKVWDWNTAFNDLPIVLCSKDDQTINWNLNLTWDWNWIVFPDGTKQTTAWSGGGWIETVMIPWDQSAWTYYFELDADSDMHIWNVVIALQVPNTGSDFVVKCYKNWDDLDKDIVIKDGGWDEVNGRYKASRDIDEDLSADDVFELEISQVWSDQPGSDFSSLINIT